MCSCCCPPAVNALFCLWIRSGCSKASVAGALTFFPPDPPLYKFERYSADGELLPDPNDDGCDDNYDDDTDDEHPNNIKDDLDGEEHIQLSNPPMASSGGGGGGDATIDGDGGRKTSTKTSTTSTTTGRRPDDLTMKSPSAHTMSRDSTDEDDPYPHPPHANHRRQGRSQQTHQPQPQPRPRPTPKPVHPAQALTDRALALRKKAKLRNERDALDAAMNITYKFLPDPRLTRPPSFSGRIEAVKIGPHRKTNHFIAALIYRVRPDRVTAQTKTIVYSHGNATDIGAMYFMQIILAKGLQCNVVMYDYSGYGASGGVPLEHSTYHDVEMVYDYTLNRVVANREERNIVVYGQSVGSGPSCYIVTNRPGVGGLILHSPFMSGMRVLTPSRYVFLFFVGLFVGLFVCWFVGWFVCSMQSMFMIHLLLFLLAIFFSNIYIYILYIEHWHV